MAEIPSKNPSPSQTLYDRLMARRDAERERMRSAPVLVCGDDRPWEDTPHGRLKWLMHPDLRDRAMHAFVMYLQEIPPGGASGKLRQQGEVVFSVLRGSGYTIIDGEAHQWESGDCINIGSLPEGRVFQHFNADPDQPALLIAAMPDAHDALGVDMGCGLDQLEPAPSWPGQGP